MTIDLQGTTDPARPLQLLLMRHPQTVSNVEGRYVGQGDSPPSALGESQLPRAVSGLIAWRPDALLSSPLGRCLAIAQPVAAATGLVLETDAELMEMAFGALEGLTHDEARARGVAMPWDDSEEPWPAPGAEGFEEFAQRLGRVAEGLSRRQGRVAVVTHGGVIRGLTAHWLGITNQRFWSSPMRNVESACFSADRQGTIYLEGFGLRPEWLGSLAAGH